MGSLSSRARSPDVCLIARAPRESISKTPRLFFAALLFGSFLHNLNCFWIYFWALGASLLRFPRFLPAIIVLMLVRGDQKLIVFRCCPRLLPTASGLMLLVRCDRKRVVSVPYRNGMNAMVAASAPA